MKRSGSKDGSQLNYNVILTLDSTSMEETMNSHHDTLRVHFRIKKTSEKPEKLLTATNSFHDAFFDLSNAYMYELGTHTTARIYKCTVENAVIVAMRKADSKQAYDTANPNLTSYASKASKKGSPKINSSKVRLKNRKPFIISQISRVIMGPCTGTEKKIQWLSKLKQP